MIEGVPVDLAMLKTVPGALALLVWLLLVATKKNLLAPLWRRVPDAYQSLIPIVVAALAGALPDLLRGNLKAAGVSLISAALQSGTAAAGLHHILKSSPLSYGSKDSGNAAESHNNGSNP